MGQYRVGDEVTATLTGRVLYINGDDSVDIEFDLGQNRESTVEYVSTSMLSAPPVRVGDKIEGDSALDALPVRSVLHELRSGKDGELGDNIWVKLPNGMWRGVSEFWDAEQERKSSTWLGGVAFQVAYLPGVNA